MRTFLCLGCGEVYNESIAHEENILEIEDGGIGYRCPKVNCNCMTVEVDDFLVSVIRNLNNLCFYTVACCSGHTQDSMCVNIFTPRTYILFSRDFGGDIIPEYILEKLSKTLPEGFELEIPSYNDNRFTISRSVPCTNESECMMAIAENCALLLKWTETELKDFVEEILPDGIEGYPIWFYDNDFEGELDDEDADNIEFENSEE